MANSYSQIYVHLVFSVAYRDALIYETFREELYKYITGGIKAQGHLLIAIGGVSDHIHILIRYNPSQSISALVQSIKIQSAKWINSNRFVKCNFAWQKGYGAFSYSQSQVSAVVKYINTQQQHHQRLSFIDEYRRMLEQFQVEFNDEYLFSEPQ